MDSENGFIQKVEKIDSKTNEEVIRVESKLKEIVPIQQLVKIFGDETYLIGGAIRDVVLNKNVSDFDLMTRMPIDIVLENLKNLGFIESKDAKFSEGCFSIKEGVGVVNMVLDGKEIQVASIGDRSIENLIATADINFNCGAFNLGSQTIVDADRLTSIQKKELLFSDPQSALSDPMKVVSALKQISRVTALRVPEETIQTIRTAMPTLVAYFRSNPERRHKLKPLFGNINSREVQDLFYEYDAKDILDEISLKKEMLDVSSPYVSLSVRSLTPEVKEKIKSLIVKQYGRRLNPNKVFNTKVNSVAYELNHDGEVVACCLLDGERIYSVASTSADSIVGLVADLCRNNYNVWATISISSPRVIDLSVQAGLKLVSDQELIKKVLVSNYPEYLNKIIVEKKDNHVVFTKQDSDDPPQVLLIS